MAIAAPAIMLFEYNHMEEGDPKVLMYRMHPMYGEEFAKFGIFLDYYDTAKNVVCFLVWSTTDNRLLCLPNAALNPYPLCWNCVKDFGNYQCAKCHVAKYCSKECQVTHWKSHKTSCPRMEAYGKNHELMRF